MIVAALLATFIAVLAVGILIGIGWGRDDERARQSENRSFIGALDRHDARPLR